MTELVFRIKDLEAHPEGVQVDTALGVAFLSWALTDTDADAERSSATLKARLLHQAGQGGTVLCHGTLTGALAAQCQRCLGPASIPLDCRLHMTFVPPGSHVPDGRQLDPEDPDDVDYAHHDRAQVDLREVLREQILLSIPITVLCEEDCLGLCPQCGADLNVAPCGCQPSAPLSPFAVLKNLKA